MISFLASRSDSVPCGHGLLEASRLSRWASWETGAETSFELPHALLNYDENRSPSQIKPTVGTSHSTGGLDLGRYECHTICSHETVSQ